MQQRLGQAPLAYDLDLIKTWQKKLAFSDEQVATTMDLTLDQYHNLMVGQHSLDQTDLATEKFRKVALKRLFTGLDTRSTYLLNGIKYDIEDLQLSPVTVQKVTGVSATEYNRFLTGQSDASVYEDAFDRMGVYYKKVSESER